MKKSANHCIEFIRLREASTQRKSMSNKIEFKASASGVFGYLLLTNGLVGVAFFLVGSHSKQVAIVLFGIVNISYIFSAVLKPSRMIIDKATGILEIHYPIRLCGRW